MNGLNCSIILSRLSPESVILVNRFLRLVAGRGLNFERYSRADWSVMKLLSTSDGVPIMSKMDSKMWPSVCGKPSASTGSFGLGESGKH